MTRASLLHILDNLGGISETEVQELEQLAATFPYCQTAHLLLAKAAHDRGSMLAAQRLRRAATYAVDRQQLRALIELPAPMSLAEVPATAKDEHVEAVPMAQLAIVAPLPVDTIAAGPELSQAADNSESPETDISDNQSLDGAYDAKQQAIQDSRSTSTELEAKEAPTQVPFSEAVLLDATSEIPLQADTESNDVSDTPFHEVDGQLAEELTEPPVVADSAVEETPLAESAEADVAIIAADPDVFEPIEEPFASTAGVEDSFVTIELETELTESELTEEELPLTPPPIRPPVEVGSSRFEFGLAQTLPVPTYNLFEVEKAVAKQPAVIPPFWADEEVGYAPGLGSRLGFCLQAHDEYSLDLPPSAFFEPDALLLQYLKQHQPVLPPVPTSIDLIDKFLRSKPRFRAPLPLPPTTEAQADLSVRSTLAEPSLASESLARILVRQGKIGKAIEIYERLIVRQPEKKAYFADQIQQLQTFE
ncbi:hypothetical protein H8B13_02685 [Hymenobacter sp. BT188]|uniref:hypothetical protein n=1 Tax=Hymenobacter sp. BT188 TaxID=2763504 RepID=UPI00165135FE|nr:hypothetical protein [Hymenobacter sp. BT188]MBC6605715.1 hypothetical protein [Hymenobacter sp. BT188]